jgi:2-polyprenyl-6-methoxyphenol hydroxylase-like FAD-dependent oxidoreductase
MLANELGRRGASAILIDQKSTTAFNPQANATQARTMEHFRRLGCAREIRALGLPPDFPTDIAYFTRYAGYELARFKLPSSREATARVKQLSGSWSAAELPHRVSQKYVEQVLRRHAEALPDISVHYGWRLTGFTEAGRYRAGQRRPPAPHPLALSDRRRRSAQYGAAGARLCVCRGGRLRPRLLWRAHVRHLSACAGFLSRGPSPARLDECHIQS